MDQDMHEARRRGERNGLRRWLPLGLLAAGIIAFFAADTTLTARDNESIRFLNDNRDKFLGAILNKVETFNLEL